MFLRVESLPSLSEARLHGLCASLNTPVVNIEGMRVGPARAAIIVYADDLGGIELVVGVRSLENGQVQVFPHQGELDPMLSPAKAMESALSFAEGMGFLFDQDMVESGGQAGRVRALRHWQELVGESPHPRGASAPRKAELSPEDTAVQVDDVLLDDGADFGDDELLLDDLALDDLPDEIILDEDSELTLDEDSELSLDEAPDLSIPPSALPGSGGDTFSAGFHRQRHLEQDEAGARPNAAMVSHPRERDPDAEATAAPDPPSLREVSLSKFRDAAADDASEPVAKASPSAKKPDRVVKLDRTAKLDVSAANVEARLHVPEGDEDSLGPSELGRIPLVKLRVEGADSERPSLLARLLGSF